MRQSVFGWEAIGTKYDCLLVRSPPWSTLLIDLESNGRDRRCNEDTFCACTVRQGIPLDASIPFEDLRNESRPGMHTDQGNPTAYLAAKHANEIYHSLARLEQFPLC